MPSDRLLGTLLRSLQTYTDKQDTPRLLSTAASLLTTLHNPLNISLLTAQLLSAPAIWERPDGLKTCLQVMGVFHSALLAMIRKEDENEAAKQSPETHYTPYQPPLEELLPREKWLRAAIKGADERSERWKHLLMFSGLLAGIGPSEDERISSAMRRTIERAMVQATNLALPEVRNGDDLGAQSISLALNHAFPLLAEYERAEIDYMSLLPVLLGSAFFSSEGLQSAYFLGAIDLEIQTMPDGKLNWSPRSMSFHQIEKTLSRPLVSSLGPLSRLIAHAVENVPESWIVQTVVDDLTGFSKTLLGQWRQCRLSTIDAPSENSALTPEALKTSMPGLWRLLRVTLFALVIVLRGVAGRVLNDAALASNATAPGLAQQILHTLRSLYFISSRLGTESFSQYTFVYLTAIDVLANYPPQANSFMREIRPSSAGEIPTSPLERCLDLYFLNTAEHFTLILSPQSSEELLVSATIPYLASGRSNHLLPIFEAAHSVMLAVFSAPLSAPLAAKHLPFYVDALFSVFPQNLSPRQFRLAFKTLLRVTAPPAPLSASQPDLPATLLELVHHRAIHAPANPLAPNLAPHGQSMVDEQTSLSEQAVLTLTLIDALPTLPLDLLEEWLPLSADLVHRITDGQMREQCRARLWEVLISGEMDPERSQVCVTWWSSRGGRESVLFGPGGVDSKRELRSGGEQIANHEEDQELFMSGALVRQGTRTRL